MRMVLPVINGLRAEMAALRNQAGEAQAEVFFLAVFFLPAFFFDAFFFAAFFFAVFFFAAFFLEAFFLDAFFLPALRRPLAGASARIFLHSSSVSPSGLRSFGTTSEEHTAEL